MTVKKNFVTVIECQQKFRDRHEISNVNVMEFLSSIFCQSFLFSYYNSKFIIRVVMISSFPVAKFRITKKYLVVIVDNGCHRNADIENADIGDFSFKNVLCSRIFKYFWDILHLVHFSSSDSYIPGELI